MNNNNLLRGRMILNASVTHIFKILIVHLWKDLKLSFFRIDLDHFPSVQNAQIDKL